MLFDPESWLELKNNKSGINQSELHKQDKYEDYVSIYPKKILGKIK